MVDPPAVDDGCRSHHHRDLSQVTCTVGGSIPLRSLLWVLIEIGASGRGSRGVEIDSEPLPDAVVASRVWDVSTGRVCRRWLKIRAVWLLRACGEQVL